MGSFDDARYEDIDENGDPIGRSKSRPDWQTKPVRMPELLHKAFMICGGRKYFVSPQEQRAWTKIEKSLDQGKMSVEWVNNCFGWAKQKNQNRLVIKFASLLSLILNINRQLEWEAKSEVILPGSDLFDTPEVQEDLFAQAEDPDES
jgi:hypothetical protein